MSSRYSTTGSWPGGGTTSISKTHACPGTIWLPLSCLVGTRLSATIFPRECCVFAPYFCTAIWRSTGSDSTPSGELEGSDAEIAHSAMRSRIPATIPIFGTSFEAFARAASSTSEASTAKSTWPILTLAWMALSCNC